MSTLPLLSEYESIRLLAVRKKRPVKRLGSNPKFGRPPKDPRQTLSKHMRGYLTEEESEALDAARGEESRGQYARKAMADMLSSDVVGTHVGTTEDTRDKMVEPLLKPALNTAALKFLSQRTGWTQSDLVRTAVLRRMGWAISGSGSGGAQE